MLKILTASISLLALTACVGFKDGPATLDSQGGEPDDDAPPEGLANIQALRRGQHALGDTVTVEGVVLGRQLDIGFFVAERGGEPWSGVWVYAPGDGGALAEGTRVRVTGVYEEYSQEGEGTITELNLEESGSVEVLEEGVALPPPTVLTAAQLSDPEAAEPYECMLVELRDATVTNADLGYGEWEVEGGVIVNDSFYAPDNLAPGQTFSVIKGVLNFHYGAFKIEPRYPRDLQR